MAQQVTIGGNRVGSGKKMKGYINDYKRSTHNLSEFFASSMASGVLYPCLVKPAMRGDSFDIDINADARTVPTTGPLFGSFKMQVDVYQCPVRLYQALLHNNPLALGLNMKDVMMPMVRITNQVSNNVDIDRKSGKFSNSSLMKYLGFSGVGELDETVEHTANTQWGRDLLAVPMLAYYDIFKNYYANKQEENAYVISETQETSFEDSNITSIEVNYLNQNGESASTITIMDEDSFPFITEIEGENTSDFNIIIIKGEHLSTKISIEQINGDLDGTLESAAASGYITLNKVSTSEIIFTINTHDRRWLGISSFEIDNASGYAANRISLVEFPLKNIDDMRYDILSFHELGQPFYIKMGEDAETQEHYYLPYSTIAGQSRGNYYNLNCNPMNGLVLKTYQNDMFNNWLNSEWIEGENGINELTKVEIVDGAFSMDALNLAQRLYNMLNRVAISGGTYEDWQDVVYEQVQRRQIESPIYLGGMSQEIYFDEVIQTAPADGKPLGELGGRGKLSGDMKGGKIHVKCDETSFIIGIVSLTPRIFYTQGNEFYGTEIKSLDDFHKPALDGIGFQDLIGERMAYFDTKLNGFNVTHRSKIGKLPAWIDYMTSYNKAYGDFAETEGKGYMILNRNYERDEETGGIKDATTYIDPSKYNYAFAVQELEAQNFWVEIAFKITARRKMSARIIPNV